MGLVAAFLVRFLLVVLYGLLPGAALVTLWRCRFASAVDGLLACITASVAWTVICVHALLLLGLYTRETAALILIVPAIALAWLYFGKGVRIADLRAAASPDAAEPPRPLPAMVDRAVILGVAAYLLLFLLDASTSPITGWDGNITWDKWAVDWARRSDLYGYLVGGYPQMMPMFSSVLYKLTGTYQQAIPLEQFVLHALQGVNLYVLLAAVVRLARLMRLPAWPVVLLTFGNPQVLSVAMSASADVVLMMFVIVAATLFVSWLAGQWESPYGVTVGVAPALFGACFTKANGTLALLIPLAFFLCQRFGLLDRQRFRLISARALAATLVLPLVACLPFYIYQIAEKPSPATQSVHETNFAASGMVNVLEKTTASSYEKPAFSARVMRASDRLLASFDRAGRWPLAALALATVLIVLSLRHPLARPLLLPALTILALWFQFASYDLRNGMPALPMLGILAAAGGMELQRLLPRRGARLALAVCWLIAAAPLAANLAASTRVETTLFRVPPGAAVHRSLLAQRLETMTGNGDDRIKLFFPGEWPMYAFVKSIAPGQAASNIHVTGHIYRWFTAGAYPLAVWYHTWIRPGDLYIGAGPHIPPSYDDWSLLRESLGFRVWLRDVNPRVLTPAQVLLTGSTPPKIPAPSTGAALDLVTQGPQGLVVYNVPERDLRAGSAIVWRALVEANSVGAGLRSSYLVYDPAVIDPDRTGVMVDTQRAGANLIAYSGILTLSGKPVSQNPDDGILVGIASTQAGTPIRLREFRVSIYR